MRKDLEGDGIGDPKLPAWRWRIRKLPSMDYYGDGECIIERAVFVGILLELRVWMIGACWHRTGWGVFTVHVHIGPVRFSLFPDYV
jgi:hypothetical protein